jgi:maltose alpha-D-glucosyltransferase/alpha-amylase
VPEVGWGDFKVISVRDPAVFVVRYDWRNNAVLFVHNLDEKPREVSFAVGLDGEEGKLLINLLAEDHSRSDKNGKHTRSIWIPLVSRRRTGLSAETQRHRRRERSQ